MRNKLCQPAEIMTLSVPSVLQCYACFNRVYDVCSLSLQIKFRFDYDHSVIDALALGRHWRFWSFGLKGGGRFWG